ncbi:MAG: type II toxin-antitoxin system PemK/MazF family toxin [Oscillatoriales cyanobacterium SM2_1_8]|nr:type II toxin-antitoxin system PemK/MazF family toxin [Oscillatoriales cyanobacterium SM2_1_8]
MAPTLVQRGSVVLIHYPFTDLTGTKVRPALVLTPNLLLPQLEDVLCLFISSVVPDDFLPTDFVLLPEHPSFPATGLRQRSVFRMHKLALLHKVLVVRILGESDGRLFAEVNPRLCLALGL